jgi:hypothetical protein
MSCCNQEEKTPFIQHSLVRAGASIIKHYTDPTYNAFVDDETKAERLKMCNECDNKEQFFGVDRCKICTCFIDAKSSLVDQDCPHPNGSKWQKEKK